MNLRERVARNLRRLRQEKSVSQEELAHLAQVNRNYVGMLEREEYAASIDMLEKLALALDIDPIEFLRAGGDVPGVLEVEFAARDQQLKLQRTKFSDCGTC